MAGRAGLGLHRYKLPGGSQKDRDIARRGSSSFVGKDLEAQFNKEKAEIKTYGTLEEKFVADVVGKPALNPATIDGNPLSTPEQKAAARKLREWSASSARIAVEYTAANAERRKQIEMAKYYYPQGGELNLDQQQNMLASSNKAANEGNEHWLKLEEERIRVAFKGKPPAVIGEIGQAIIDAGGVPGDVDKAMNEQLKRARDAAAKVKDSQDKFKKDSETKYQTDDELAFEYLLLADQLDKLGKRPDPRGIVISAENLKEHHKKLKDIYEKEVRVFHFKNWGGIANDISWAKGAEKIDSYKVTAKSAPVIVNDLMLKHAKELASGSRDYIEFDLEARSDGTYSEDAIRALMLVEAEAARRGVKVKSNFQKYAEEHPEGWVNQYLSTTPLSGMIMDLLAHVVFAPIYFASWLATDPTSESCSPKGYLKFKEGINKLLDDDQVKAEADLQARKANLYANLEHLGTPFLRLKALDQEMQQLQLDINDLTKKLGGLPPATTRDADYTDLLNVQLRQKINRFKTCMDEGRALVQENRRAGAGIADREKGLANIAELNEHLNLREQCINDVRRDIGNAQAHIAVVIAERALHGPVDPMYGRYDAALGADNIALNNQHAHILNDRADVGRDEGVRARLG